MKQQMKKTIIFGTGQFAEVAFFYLNKYSEDIIEAFTVNKEYFDNNTFCGRDVIPFEEIENKFPPEKYKLFVPFNYTKMNKIRENIYKAGKKMGYEFSSYIDPNCRCNASYIGENCFILENNVIQPYTRIENNVILWSGNHIGHHSVIKENCFIASHAVISGSVLIGENSFLGVNCTIRDNIKIGKENVIGAGSLITVDTEDYAVYPSKGTEKSKVPSNRLRRI